MLRDKETQDKINLLYNGLQKMLQDGWIDADCVWNYINCPNCSGNISVDDKIDLNEYRFLEKKFEDEFLN